MIEFKQVSKTFLLDGRTVDAVKDVSFRIEQGTICGIIGFSGAGKSTLVRCINLLERPTKGSVIIDGTDITTLRQKDLREARSNIGMIFQQFHLFASRTVADNIAYPLKHKGLSRKEIKERVSELLELVGLSEKAGAYPNELSGGQKQRVAIARALANNPKILLSDESTSALDPQTTKSILSLLRELNKKLGITIVIITHEMEVVKEICNQVVVMEEGRVVEEGEVFELFSNPKEQITKNFVGTTSNLSKIYDLIDQNAALTKLKQGDCIMKFTYIKRSTSEALVSLMSRKFDLDINIIFGNIDMIGEHPIGGLVAIVRGEATKMEQAIRYLKEKEVGVEVLLDARAA